MVLLEEINNEFLKDKRRNGYFKKPLNAWSWKTEATLKIGSKKFILK